MSADPYPDIIPPGSSVRLARADDSTPAWKGREGETFTIGYYCKGCGLEIIWLVTPQGKYLETLDRPGLLKYFDILSISDETDLFGEHVDPAHDV